jgi:hypothetical protein
MSFNLEDIVIAILETIFEVPISLKDYTRKDKLLNIGRSKAEAIERVKSYLCFKTGLRCNYIVFDKKKKFKNLIQRADDLLKESTQWENYKEYCHFPTKERAMEPISDKILMFENEELIRRKECSLMEEEDLRFKMGNIEKIPEVQKFNSLISKNEDQIQEINERLAVSGGKFYKDYYFLQDYLKSTKTKNMLKFFHSVMSSINMHFHQVALTVFEESELVKYIEMLIFSDSSEECGRKRETYGTRVDMAKIYKDMNQQDREDVYEDMMMIHDYIVNKKDIMLEGQIDLIAMKNRSINEIKKKAIAKYLSFKKVDYYHVPKVPKTHEKRENDKIERNVTSVQESNAFYRLKSKGFPYKSNKVFLKNDYDEKVESDNKIRIQKHNYYKWKQIGGVRKKEFIDFQNNINEHLELMSQSSSISSDGGRTEEQERLFLRLNVRNVVRRALNRKKIVSMLEIPTHQMENLIQLKKDLGYIPKPSFLTIDRNLIFYRKGVRTFLSQNIHFRND